MLKEGKMKIEGNLVKLIMLVLPLVLVGCGKEREIKTLPRIDVMAKSLINENTEMMSVASTGQVSRTTSFGRPYFQGQEKIVKLEFQEHNLVAYAVDKETRFDDNITNRKVVFKIPIEHLAFREQTDAFGETINVEEKNEFIPWNERPYFRAKPEEFKFTSVETLPTEFGKIFGDQSCLTDQGQSDLEFTVKEDGIDIVIKRDYTSSIFCENNVDELFDLTWSEVTHYNLVPLDSLISKDYERTVYDREWERTFGYFDHVDKKLDSSNSDTQAQEEFLIHRWDPNREKIVYHLDPKFNKPENLGLKQATLLGLDRLNDSLAESGAKMRIETVEGDENFRPGNIRYSSIVMVEDPVGAGLLGYGPSVANPRTGEIVQARTVMYPGIMRKLIKRAYDELIETSSNSVAAPSPQPNQEDDDSGEVIGEGSQNQDRVMAELKKALSEKKDLHSHIKWAKPSTSLKSGSLSGDSADQGNLFAGNSGSSFNSLKALKKESFFKRTLDSARTLFQRLASSGDADNSIEEINQIDLIEAYSKNNMMPALVETFTDIADKDLQEQILAMGEGQEWVDLDESVRESIVNLVMPYVWIPTLIHEVGHNLGLRHNFQGSEDKDNFYTLEELKAKGVTSSLGSPYSSMMEYSKSEITGLRVPGKYDIAALRYAYAGMVEMPDGSIVEASSVSPSDIKEYGYCSDEGVPLNAGCNRFDEGTNLVEIMESQIDSYERRYKDSYKRNGRANFSMIDDLSAAARTNSMFRSMRIAFERVSDIMIEFNVDYDQIKEIEWLDDMNKASIVAAEFLMNVVAEPDYSCVVFQDGQFNGIVPFSTFGRGSDSCYDVELNPGFQVVGELGKDLKSRKYSTNTNIFIDQIDVRGVWFNKVLAMRYLMARSLGSLSFDDNTISYMDHPEIGPKLNKFVKDLVYGDVVANTEITFLDGTKQDFEYAHSLSVGYEIENSLFGLIHRGLRIPMRKADLNEILVSQIKNESLKGNPSIGSDELYESLTVYNRLDNINDGDFESYEVGGSVFFVDKNRNDVGNKIISRLRMIREVYPEFSRDELVSIYLEMADPENNLGATEEVINASEDPEQAAKLVSKIQEEGVESLLKNLRGELPDEEHYYRMLRAM